MASAPAMNSVPPSGLTVITDSRRDRGQHGSRTYFRNALVGRAHVERAKQCTAHVLVGARAIG